MGPGLDMIRNYRDLFVWQKGVDFVTEVYRVTKGLPVEERYGLQAQISRSAVSIPSNIAEGYGRKSTQDYLRFLQIANGSLFEFQTQLEIIKNLEYITHEHFNALYARSREIERMLKGLIDKLCPRR